MYTAEMSLVLSIGGLFLCILSGILIYRWIFWEKKLIDIPGPKGWPLFGNSLQIDSMNPHKTFSEWSRKYGGMFKIKIFHDNAVVLNDIELIQEALNSKACSSRPCNFRSNEIAVKDMVDIIFQNYSSAWIERKKALTRSLNAYGTGLMKIETITLEFIDKLMSDILADSDNFSKSIDVRQHIHMCTAGIITTLYFGRKFKESELIELLEYEKGFIKLTQATGFISVLDYLPWMRHLPFRCIQEPIKDAEDFREWIQEKYCEESDVPGILDSLKLHENKITSMFLTRKELLGITHNVIIAGFSTTNASLYSLILTLINFPDIQEKMHDEIQQVTKEKRPTLTHRSSMTYIKAVMEESFRYSSVAPLIQHYSGEDTSIAGRFIPRGTRLLANIWKLHHDEQYYDEPWNFKPERFLTPNGAMVSSYDPVYKHSLPFGSGKRVCPGEGPARNRIFLIIANLLQKYKFLPEDAQNIPTCDPRQYDSGLVLKPFSFKIKVAKR